MVAKPTMDSRSRLNAIQEARTWLESNPVYLDTETTGLGETSEVIEIGIIDDRGAVLFDQLVNPRGPMDPAARNKHGITDDQLKTAPTWEKIWPLVEVILTGRRIGVYNVEFDLRLMRQSHRRAWLNWTLSEANFFDIMKLYARFHGDWDPIRISFRYQSLEVACRQCGIPVNEIHRAVGDCLLARALLHHMAESK